MPHRPGDETLLPLSPIDLLHARFGMLYDDKAIEVVLAAVHGAMFSAMSAEPDLRGMGTTVAGVVLSADDALNSISVTAAFITWARS